MDDNINEKAKKHFLGDASLSSTKTEVDVVNEMEEKFQSLKEAHGIMKNILSFVNDSQNPDPIFKHAGDSGFDLRADLVNDGPITLKPLERYMVPTGLFFDIPSNYEVQVRPRSGMAAKHGIGVLNSPGTVDEQYTGEVKVILVNLSNEPYTINDGDRIAQGVLMAVSGSNITELKRVDQITKETSRGTGGFGSTGYK